MGLARLQSYIASCCDIHGTAFHFHFRPPIPLTRTLKSGGKYWRFDPGVSDWWVCSIHRATDQVSTGMGIEYRYRPWIDEEIEHTKCLFLCKSLWSSVSSIVLFKWTRWSLVTRCCCGHPMMPICTSKYQTHFLCARWDECSKYIGIRSVNHLGIYRLTAKGNRSGRKSVKLIGINLRQQMDEV